MSENIGDSERNLWIAVITNAAKAGNKRFLESNWCKTICCWVDINYEILVKERQRRLWQKLKQVSYDSLKEEEVMYEIEVSISAGVA